jgi:SAM-dependent methyltransferase
MLEENLPNLKETISVQNFGYCHCCRKETIFKIFAPWLRDYYECLNCRSVPRQRHLQYILDNFFADWTNKFIHESSPMNNFISQFCNEYSFSHYFEDAELGSIKDGIRCENLENLTFADDTFDIFVTQDVLEHVFNPESACREIMRVLRPGGIHIFTVPKHKSVKNSYQRAKSQDGKIEYIFEEVYHGSPIGDGRCLVTWDYGDDFEYLVSMWSKFPTISYLTIDRDFGLDGDYIEVFVTKKPLNDKSI